MISIRLAKIKDAEIIAEIGAKTFAESNYTKNKKALDLYLKKTFNKVEILKVMRSKLSVFLIAFSGDTPVGYAKFNRKSVESMELEKIYILKKWTGKKIGTALLEKGLAIAKKEKVKAMIIQVWEKNLKAIKIYKKWGFKPFDKASFDIGGVIQKDILMKKEI